MGAGERDADESLERHESTAPDSEQAKTRVVDDGRTEIVESAGGGASDGATAVIPSADDLALAETRILDEDDKTSPPPVAAPRADSPPRPPQAPRPAPAPAARDLDRGLQPGTVLFGEYEIVSVLGVGGMGEVYRAHHRRLDEHRAIKVMHAELSKRRGASEFFYREAKALLAVRHPAVVHCHDLLSDDAGRVYLIMEMIEGIPLSRKLNTGPLSPDEVAILGARVAHGLAAAHRKGVIHRDLSPDNIVLPNGRVQEAKIIDFGIAKLLEQGEGTIVDGFKGKLSYASPEQLGFFGGKLDGRSDLYSLGLVLAAASLGRPMAMGTTVMEAVDARRNLRALPDAIPVGLRSAIQPLLALDPNDRPQYVDRLFVVPGSFEGAEDADGFTGSTSTRAAHEPRRSSAPVRASRTPLLAGIATAAAVVIAGAIYLVPRATPAPPASETRSTAATPATTATNAATPAAVSPDPGATAGSATAGDAARAAAAAQPAAPSVAVVPADTARPEVVAAPARPAEVAAVKPPAAKPRGPSASDRLRIVGMLTNAKLAIGEDRLMSPPGDNAYERYRSVLRLEPGNQAAKSGLRDIAARYVKRANEALDQGDAAGARDHLRNARQADASSSGIRAVEKRLAAGT